MDFKILGSDALRSKLQDIIFIYEKTGEIIIPNSVRYASLLERGLYESGISIPDKDTYIVCRSGNRYMIN